MAIAENLRVRVAEHNFHLPCDKARVTISLGVAQYQDGESENSFFARADDALYSAKNGGRNYTQASLPPQAVPQLF